MEELLAKALSRIEGWQVVIVVFVYVTYKTYKTHSDGRALRILENTIRTLLDEIKGSILELVSEVKNISERKLK